MKNNIIIQFEMFTKGGDGFCHATCDGITIGNNSGETPKLAGINCYELLVDNEKVEDGTFCIFVNRQTGFDFRGYHNAKKPFTLHDLGAHELGK